MRVLSPVGESRYAGAKDELSSNVSHLDNKVVGIIDDGAGKAYFQRIKKLFEENYRGVQIIHRVKPTLSAPAPVQLIDQVAQAVDVAIVGTGV